MKQRKQPTSVAISAETEGVIHIACTVQGQDWHKVSSVQGRDIVGLKGF